MRQPVNKLFSWTSFGVWLFVHSHILLSFLLSNPGKGNIDSDPLFFYMRGYDYLLLRDSPSIDAGDPLSEDGFEWPEFFGNGLRADMGAYGGPGNLGWLP
jgi:hypothetical protein